MRARLSVLGLYRFDNKLFELLKVPNGVDVNLVVDRILMQCAEYEVLFPSWDYMHYIIGKWSEMRLGVWERLQRTINMDYDPIYNYNRIEEWEDSGTTKNQGSYSGSERETGSSSSNATNTQQTAGFNTDVPKTHDVDTTNGTGSQEISRSDSHSNTDNGESYGKHTGRVYGNIGVTTTQQLIREEREISEFNMYDYIADDFAREFCLLVY